MADSPQPAGPQRLRRRLLLKVQQWVSGVLERSLHGLALIDLGLAQHPGLVYCPWRPLLGGADAEAISLPAGTRLIELFDACGGEIVVLGAPGAGKTTLLLDLARDLLARAERDAQHPIPIVLNLASWSQRRLPLARWIEAELYDQYNLPRRVARALVAADALLLLLDGLDEVAPAHQSACVAAINAFRAEHHVDIAIGSRTEDYTRLPERLRVQGAIVLQPLTADQVDAFLQRGGDQLAGLQAALQHDPGLRELATSPLMLEMMILAYQHPPARGALSQPASQGQREQLFDIYLARILSRRSQPQRYAGSATRPWLAWPAWSRKRRPQLQPDWLQSRREQLAYQICHRLRAGLLIGLLLSAGYGAIIVGYGVAMSFPSQYMADFAHDLLVMGALGFVLGVFFSEADEEDVALCCGWAKPNRNTNEIRYRRPRQQAPW